MILIFFIEVSYENPNSSLDTISDYLPNLINSLAQHDLKANSGKSEFMFVSSLVLVSKSNFHSVVTLDLT